MFCFWHSSQSSPCAGKGDVVDGTVAPPLFCESFSTITNNTGIMKTAINVAANIPPITVVPMIWGPTNPAPVAAQSGPQPSTQANEGFRNGPQRHRARASAHYAVGRPLY